MLITYLFCFLAGSLLILLAIFASGFALALSTLSVYFRDLGYLWSIVMQVWFFLTPIIYGPEVVQNRVPEWAQWLLRMNPMVHFVSAYRDAFYDNHLPSLSKVLVLIGCSALSLVLDAFGRYEDVQRRIPDRTLCERVLGYAPGVSLEDGLPKTIAWQKAEMRKAGML